MIRPLHKYSRASRRFLREERSLSLSRRLLVGHPAERQSRGAIVFFDWLTRVETHRRRLAERWTDLAGELPEAPALHSAASGDARSVQERGRAALEAMARSSDQKELPHITISVVTFESERWIDAWVASLLLSDYPADHLHLVVRDHSQNKHTLHALERTLSGSDLGSMRLYQGANVGFGAGHDDIIGASHNRYVLVSNIDLEFESQAIRNVVSAGMADDENVACWELRQTPFEHPKYYDPYTLQTWWCSHACVLVDREHVLKAGGYDKQIFMYCEDVELSLRLRSAGYLLRYVPSAVVRHHTYNETRTDKPHQLEGSLLGSTHIKLKFSTLRELAGHAAKLARLVRGRDTRLVRAARSSLVHLQRNVWRWPFYRMLYPRLPFFGFDYELTRDGAFFASERRLLQAPVEDRPLVTIIIRTHGDRCDLARGALASVLRQTYRPIEILLCEDGGSGIGEQLSKEVSAQSGITLKLIACERVGRSKTANAGLRAASGIYVGFLDDDDAFFADHVETLVHALQMSDSAGAAYSKAFEVECRSVGGELQDTRFGMAPIYARAYSAEALQHINLFPIQSVLFRSALISDVGYMDEGLDMLEDWNFWCRLSAFTDFLRVDKTTSLYRVPGDAAERQRRTEALNAAYADVQRANRTYSKRAEAGGVAPVSLEHV